MKKQPAMEEISNSELEIESEFFSFALITFAALIPLKRGLFLSVPMLRIVQRGQNLLQCCNKCMTSLATRVNAIHCRISF